MYCGVYIAITNHIHCVVYIFCDLLMGGWVVGCFGCVATGGVLHRGVSLASWRSGGRNS